MFCVVYRFVVKAGSEKDFEDAWAGLTDLIYQYEGSLGSRLHRSAPTEYIAYAQWPHRKAWETADNLPPEADPLRVRMRAALEVVETLHELEVVNDRLEDRVALGAGDTYS